MLQSIRAGRDLYDGKPFGYCPWCGTCLLEASECKHPRLDRCDNEGMYQCHECYALLSLRRGP
jgi:hypothetical protein